MDVQTRLRSQIRAGRELIGMSQVELAEALGSNKSRISRVESGDIKSLDTLFEIKTGLEQLGISFTRTGVELNEEPIEILEGEDCYLRLLDDVYSTLKGASDKELLIMFASDSASPPEVNNRYQFMRQNGIRMRQIIEEGDHHILGKLEEYRTIPAEYFTNIVTVIYASKVAQVSGTETRLTIQKDEQLSTREKKMFSYFWDNGKKPEHSSVKERFNP